MHIHCSGPFLLDGVISDATDSTVVGDDGRRGLRVSEFLEDSALLFVTRGGGGAIAAGDVEGRERGPASC
jgi:hypothetical protein